MDMVNCVLLVVVLILVLLCCYNKEKFIDIPDDRIYPNCKKLYPCVNGGEGADHDEIESATWEGDIKNCSRDAFRFPEEIYEQVFEGKKNSVGKRWQKKKWKESQKMSCRNINVQRKGARNRHRKNYSAFCKMRKDYNDELENADPTGVGRQDMMMNKECNIKYHASRGPNIKSGTQCRALKCGQHLDKIRNNRPNQPDNPYDAASGRASGRASGMASGREYVGLNRILNNGLKNGLGSHDLR
tara:strand:- start:148 stop:876 length:729 start_codon:yes stop_codon:yes gene_type:complete